MNVLNRSALKLKNNLPYFEIPELANLGWIRHAFLTRQGGVSLSPYDSLNLSDKNGDRKELVSQNKNLVAEASGFDPKRLILLDQMQKDQVLLLIESVMPPPFPLRIRCPDHEFSEYLSRHPSCGLPPNLYCGSKEESDRSSSCWKAGNSSSDHKKGFKKNGGGVRLHIKRPPYRYGSLHRLLLL